MTADFQFFVYRVLVFVWPLELVTLPWISHILSTSRAVWTKDQLTDHFSFPRKISNSIIFFLFLFCFFYFNSPFHEYSLAQNIISLFWSFLFYKIIFFCRNIFIFPCHRNNFQLEIQLSFYKDNSIQESVFIISSMEMIDP